MDPEELRLLLVLRRLLRVRLLVAGLTGLLFIGRLSSA